MNINVTRSSLPPMEEYIKEISDIWDTRWLTNVGEKHQKLSNELEKYLGVNYIDLFTNGHMALELSVESLNKTGEIITTPFTFASTIHAISRNGCKPVFCDIKDDYTIDAEKIESLISKNTVAIMPVHVYGNVCDVDTINEIARKYNLNVIYDAAHAFGEKYRGVGIGNFGDISCFSFHATKVFHTIEGGAATYNNSNLHDFFYKARNFGIHGEEDVLIPGTNAKMNEFAAAMGICNLKYIDKDIKRRKEIYELYIEALNEVEGIICNVVSDEVESNYSYFPILIDETRYGISREELLRVLQSHGIYPRKYFYPLVSSFGCYSEYSNEYRLDKATYVSERIATLPMYADLDEQQVEYICNIIKNKK